MHIGNILKRSISLLVIPHTGLWNVINKAICLREAKVNDTLLALIDNHTIDMQKILSLETLKNSLQGENMYSCFKSIIKNEDIFLSSLNYQFITKFEFYLRKCTPLDTSIMKHMRQLKK